MASETPSSNLARTEMICRLRWQPGLIGLLLFSVACGLSPAAATSTPTPEPTSTTAPTPTATLEPVPVLMVEELEGFEPRRVVFANLEFTVTGVRRSNQELRSYGEGGEPIVDEENAYVYLDISALNRLSSSMSERLTPEIYKLILGDLQVPAVPQMQFLSELSGFIPADSGVDSFLAFQVPPDAELTDPALVIGAPPDRLAHLPLSGPLPEPIFPLEIEVESSAEGVGPTNGGTIVFTVLGATLSEDNPHEHATSPTGARANEDELFLVVHVRAEKVSGRGSDLLGHHGDAFRLLVDGVPRAPWDSATHPSGSVASPSVDPGAAVDAWVAFLIPVEASELILQVGDFEQDPGLIPLELP